MFALELQKLMRANPFQPFRIRMTDGSTYEVPNHDAAFVTRNYLEVGTDLDKNSIPGKVVRCAILHITQVEDLQAASTNFVAAFRQKAEAKLKKSKRRTPNSPPFFG